MDCETHRALLSDEVDWYVNSLSWIDRQWMLIKCGTGDLFSGLFAVLLPIVLAFVVWKVARITVREYRKDPRATIGFYISAIFFQIWSIVIYTIAILMGVFTLLGSIGITAKRIESWPSIVNVPIYIGSIVAAYWAASMIVDFVSNALERWMKKKSNVGGNPS